MLGNPSRDGNSLKAMARTPLSALRLVSAAASSASHSGTMQRGMFTPPDGAHHSCVVGFDAGQGQFLVLCLIERLAAETGEGGKRQRAVGVVQCQVLDSFISVPAALS